ncbi:interleukin-22 receptor subunit alpha-2 [Polymixia lowei]
MSACLGPVNSLNTMTSLLLRTMLLGNLCLRLTASQASSFPVFLAPPAKVRFDSVDYKNVLHWNPPSNSTTLQYYIQWKIYGEPQWLDVEGCQGIRNPHCDLSDVTSDPREWYYARVHVSSLPASKSAWALSRRFSPGWETKISPPALRLNVTEQGLVVRLKPNRSLVQKMHKKLHYKIYVIHADGEEDVFEMDCCSKQLDLNKLHPRTRYCLQTQTLIPVHAKTSARSAPRCATTL